MVEPSENRGAFGVEGDAGFPLHRREVLVLGQPEAAVDL